MAQTLPSLGAAEEHARPSDLDPSHLVLPQLGLVQDGGKVVGAGVLEDVPVNAQAVLVGELAAEVGAHAV